MKRRLPDYLFIFSFFFLYSCSQLRMDFQRNLAALSNEKSDFSQDGKEDFPVVAGDEAASSLDNELVELESQQSDRAYNFYQAHKHKLGTTSQKIYFLKLPYHERREYLESRGFIAETESNSEVRYGLPISDLNGGMRKQDVLESWGRPLRVEVAGNPRNENERWLYEVNGAMKYVYFESGYVAGLE